MSEDPRCCGSGTCIIDNDGRCWCGQQWNGHMMGHVALAQADEQGESASAESVSAVRRPASCGRATDRS